MYFYTLVGTGKVISKEKIDRTIEILKDNKIEISCIEDIEECGMWLETNEEIEVEEGEILKENKICYMRFNNKLMRFYLIDEILKMNQINLEEAEEKVIVIYDEGKIDYLSYEGDKENGEDKSM